MSVSLIENVKASVDLQSFLENHGATFRRLGGGLRSDNCPCCGEGRRGSNKLGLLPDGEKWRCFSCGRGGDVIDAAAAMWCLPHRDALRRLAAEQWVSDAVPVVRRTAKRRDEGHGKPQRAAALKEALTRLHAAVTQRVPEPEGIAYLKGRGIPGRLVAQAQSMGMLGFMPNEQFKARLFLEDQVGKDLLIEAGLWQPDKKMPAIAYRPLIFFFPDRDSAEFRLTRSAEEGERKAIRYGSTSRPWYWAGEDGSKLAIVEGAIDLLSMVALGFKGDVIGIPGATVWRPEWLCGASRVAVCLDPDEAGRQATKRILAACEQLGIAAIDRAPSGGDVNDHLLSTRQAA